MILKSHVRNMLFAAGVLCAIAFAPTKSYATVTMSLSGPAFSGFNPPGGTLDLSFTETAPGVITLTITNNMTGTGTYVGSVYVNVDPALVDTTSIAYASGQVGTPSISEDAFKADGDGLYDILIDFPTPAGQRFEFGETSTYTITGAGLTENSFNFLSTPAGGHGPFIAASHVQGFPDSGWITAVPEPATAGIWALFAMSAGVPTLVRRRRIKNAT